MVSPKPWQLESVLRLAGRIALCFAVGILTASVLRHLLGEKFFEASLLNLVVAALTMQIGVLVMAALFLREHATNWTQAFGFKNQPGWAVTLGIAVAVLVVPAMWALQRLSADALLRLGFDVQEQDAVRLLREAHDLGGRMLIGVMAVAVAPLVEEVFFRGILYPFARQNGSRGFALASVSVFFALIHGNIAIFAPLVFLAVVLALLYEWTDNLLACIIVHGLFNAANFAMLFILKNSGQLPGSP